MTGKLLESVSFSEIIFALTTLHNALLYIGAQFRFDFSHSEAQANLDARAILLTAAHKVWQEGESLRRKIN
jgi:hypothetical protein